MTRLSRVTAAATRTLFQAKRGRSRATNPLYAKLLNYTHYLEPLEEICFKRLYMYALDTFYLLRFPTPGVEFLHEKNINRM